MKKFDKDLFWWIMTPVLKAEVIAGGVIVLMGLGCKILEK